MANLIKGMGVHRVILTYRHCIINVTKLNKINPLNAELNPICQLLVLLGAHHILHVSRIKVKRYGRLLLKNYTYTNRKPLSFCWCLKHRTYVHDRKWRTVVHGICKLKMQFKCACPCCYMLNHMRPLHCVLQGGGHDV